jgi:hypothetical protein
MSITIALVAALVIAAEPPAAPKALSPAAPKPMYPTVIDLNKETPPAKDVVVIVDGHHLHDPDFDAALRALNVKGTPTPQQRTAAIDLLIENQLLANAAHRLSVLPTEEVTAKLLNDVKAANGLTDAQLQAELAKSGMTLKEYVKSLEQQFIRMRVLHIRVAPQITLKDADVKAAAAREKVSEADARARLLQAEIDKRAPAFIAELRKDATVQIVKP